MTNTINENIPEFYHDYCILNYWTHGECVALSLNMNKKEIDTDPFVEGDSKFSDDQIKEYRRLMEALTRAIDYGACTTVDLGNELLAVSIRPLDYIKWAEDNRIPFPEKLKQLVKQHQESLGNYVDWEARYIASQAELEAVNARIAELKNITKPKYVWFNGELIAWEDAYVHMTTHSLHYSGAVYEGERAYNGKVFKLKQHIDRLFLSAETMQLKHSLDKETIIKAHKLVLESNNFKNAYIRPLILRGSDLLRLAAPLLSVNCMILAIESNPAFKNGLNLCISRWQKPHPKAQPPQCKSSGQYNMIIVAEIEATEAGYDDAILLDYHENIAECTTSNIFFVHQDGYLLTPLPTNCLNGITRLTVIDIAQTLGLQVIEASFSQEKILECIECFVTGTAIEIAGVDSITLESTIHQFKTHEITSILQNEYAKLVGKNVQ